MMDDIKFATDVHRTIQGAAASTPGAAEPLTPGSPGSPGNAGSPGGKDASPEAVPVSAAVERFRSCRWRATPDTGEFCTHRDVLPFAGKEGFNADSWCPECAYYKLRRTPKKRERVDYY
jgi:hypothetical protein